MLETRLYTCLIIGFVKFLASYMFHEKDDSGKTFLEEVNGQKHLSRSKLRQTSGMENVSPKGYGLNKMKNMQKIKIKINGATKFRL